MYDILYSWGGLNTKLFIAINHATNFSIFPQALQTLSSLFFIGNFAFYYLCLCIYLFIFKIRCNQNKCDYINFMHIYNELVRIGICYGLFGFIYAGLKFSVNLPRPFCSVPYGQYQTIADIVSARCLSSFPSAHTGLAIMIAYFILPYIRTYYMKLAVIIVVCLVAVSRITLAMHYPADILYSILIIAIVILLSNIIYKITYKRIIHPPCRWLYNVF